MENEKQVGKFAIRHRVEIEADTASVFKALSEQAGLAAWWTTRVEATPKVGSVARFRFGDGSHQAAMLITSLEAGRRVAWTCAEGPWKNMHLGFDLEPHERGTTLRFTHDDWQAQDDFFMHCNAKWGFFLVSSLKSYLETGSGVPHPTEPKI